MNKEHKFNVSDHIKFKYGDDECSGKILAIHITNIYSENGKIETDVSYAVVPDGTPLNIPLFVCENDIKPYKENTEPFSDDEIKQSINDLTVCGEAGSCDGCSARNQFTCGQVPAKAAKIMAYLFGKCRA